MNVYVLTSNAYVHCLPAFAYQFNYHWSAKCPVTVIHYDSHPPELPRNFSLFDNGKQDCSWSAGVLRWLRYLPDTHFILFLEDYLLDKPVNTGLVEHCIRLAERHPDIAKIDLTDDRTQYSHSNITLDSIPLVKAWKNAPFLTSLQAAIWRTDFLRAFLDDSENPWQFEKKGTKRVYAAYKDGSFDGQILGCRHAAVSYVNGIGGEGNHPHIWNRKYFSDEMWNDLVVRGLVDG